MTIGQAVTKCIEENPGKTAPELAAIIGIQNKQVASSVCLLAQQRKLKRKRTDSAQFPNIGTWIYFKA